MVIRLFVVEKFFPIYGVAARLFMWPRPFEQLLLDATYKIWLTDLVLSEEKWFETEDERRTDDDGAVLY